MRNSSKVSKNSQVSGTSSTKLYYNQNQKRFLVSDGVYSATNTKNKNSIVSSKASNPSVVLKDESSLKSSTVETRDKVWLALLPEDSELIQDQQSQEPAVLLGLSLQLHVDQKEVVRGVRSDGAGSVICLVQAMKREEMLKQVMYINKLSPLDT